MRKQKKKKWDSQSEGSNFTTPGSEGLLVTEKNGKPIGVTHPQLEIEYTKKTKRAIQGEETGLLVKYGIGTLLFTNTSKKKHPLKPLELNVLD